MKYIRIDKNYRGLIGMPRAKAGFCVDNLPNKPGKAKEYARRSVRRWILENLREV